MKPRVLIFIAAAAMMLTACSRPAPPASITLPDGTVVKIEGVTFGTNHISPASSPMQRLFDRLQANVQPWISRMTGLKPKPARRTTTTEPSLVVWAQIDSLMSTSQWGQVHIWLADEQGISSGQDANRTYWGPSFGTAQTANQSQPLTFGVFPRRGKTIQIHVGFRPSGDSKTKFAGKFTVANPDQRAPVDWRAETLPATKSSGDLSCTLTHIAMGYGNNTSTEGRRGGPPIVSRNLDDSIERRTEVGLMFRQPGAESNAWQAVDIRLADATSNTLAASSHSWDGGHESVLFRPALWPAEPAWRLTFEAKRTKDAGFASDELLVFTNVPLPALNETNAPGLEFSTSNATVRLEGIARRAPLEGNSWSSTQLSSIKLSVNGLNKGWFFDLIRTTDDAGKVVEQSGSSWSTGDSGPRSYEFSYRKILTNTASLTLTFAIQRGRKFEFLVKPEVVTKDHVPPGASPVTKER